MRRERGLTSGERLPAQYPALREAMLGGAVGVDGLVSSVAATETPGCRIGVASRLAVERELAAAAWGRPIPEGAVRPDMTVEPSPAATAEDLRLLAKAVVAYLDQDGPPPTDADAARRRGVTLGRARDGLVPVQGRLLPEVAAQVQRLFDSILNPKSTTVGVAFRPEPAVGEDAEPIDPRTPAQKQHDALATVLGVAARSGELPTVGGAAPTLVVTVRAEDYVNGAGTVRIEGTEEPGPIELARLVACCRTVQRVLFDDMGRIVGISTSDRIFNAWQRRAIAARDGGCVIPGCHVRATWCEVHHVVPAVQSGPTSTDNGVALCWHHHRTLEHSGWKIPMRQGAPEVCGPAWWDPHQRWRPARPRAAVGQPAGAADTHPRHAMPRRPTLDPAKKGAT